MQQYLEQIQAIIRNYTKAPVPVSALEELLSISSTQVFSKGDLIIAAGEESSILYILLRGLVRKFYLDATGSDITHMFLRENIFFSTDYIMIHRPSLCCFEAVEECLISQNAKELINDAKPMGKTMRFMPIIFNISNEAQLSDLYIPSEFRKTKVK